MTIAMAKAIERGRASRHWSREELAFKVQEKASLIASYESAKGLISISTLKKLEKVLGINLLNQLSS